MKFTAQLALYVPTSKFRHPKVWILSTFCISIYATASQFISPNSIK